MASLVTLPHHIDAEQAVLGGVLHKPPLYHEVCEFLTADDFYKPGHQLIFIVMGELDQLGEPIDLITLTARLKETGRLDEAGGPTYITSLLDRVVTTAHNEHHARLVHEAAVRRRMIAAAQDIEKQGYEGGEPLPEYLDYSQERLFEVAVTKKDRSFTHIKDILKLNVETIDTLYNRKESITGIASGFTDLDKMTSGFQPSDLVIIAARPSMGKTSLVMNIATNIAIKKSGAVAIFSLEMSKESLGMRMLSSLSKVDSYRLRNGQMQESDWPKLVKAAGLLSSGQMFIDDTGGITVMEMRSKCRKLAARNNLSLIIVDYLQLMQSHRHNSEGREKEIAEISRSLKQLARELKVPVVALSQLSRGVESRPDKRPMPSDLRESGAIEQDADVIMFIYRDEVYNKQTEAKGVAELIIAKQRNGPIGTVYLTWLDKYTSFENHSHQPPPMSASGGSGGGTAASTKSSAETFTRRPGTPPPPPRPPGPDLEF